MTERAESLTERDARYAFQKAHPQDDAAVVDAHAEDIVDRLGGVEAIDELALLAFADRATPARHYWGAVARAAAALTGQDDRRAAERFVIVAHHAEREYRRRFFGGANS